MLTDEAVRAAASRDKAYKLADSRGLHLHVSASGQKSWRYKYRFENKERLLTLGAYPEVSLADAREKRDEAKKILRDGRDPRHSAKRSRLIGRNDSARSFEEMAAPGMHFRLRAGNRCTPTMSSPALNATSFRIWARCRWLISTSRFSSRLRSAVPSKQCGGFTPEEGEPQVGTRDVIFDGETHSTPILKRARLAPGKPMASPAIVEEESATTVVPPGYTITIDPFGNMLVAAGESA